MKVLAIGAHPDDIEIYMYGFLAACLSRKDEVIVAVATDGVAGTVNTKKNLFNTRKKETIKGLSLIGLPDFLSFPDGELSYNIKAGILIKNYISRINPDLIITHAPEDYHPDHNALSNFVVQGSGFSVPVLFADTLMGINFVPEYYVDITPYFKDKEQAILKHKSQNPKKFVEATRLLNRFRSAQCNASEGNYAEAYRFHRKFPFSEIRALLPDSPSINPFYQSLSNSMI
jgi:LmbE family N-acetylglucosaminyl deacetylase